MGGKRLYGKKKPKAKGQKSNDKNNARESSVAGIASMVPSTSTTVTAASNAVVGCSPAATIKQTGAIFKLDIDCFEETFDYLWFEELCFMSHTCKRLNQVAGYCFQQNYQGYVVCDSNGFGRQFGSKTFKMKHLIPFIQKIDVSSINGIDHFYEERSKFHQLKQLQVHCAKTYNMDEFMEFSEMLDAGYDVDEIEEMFDKDSGMFEVDDLKDFSMPNLEDLQLAKCDLGTKFHEIIERFPKLKRLQFDTCEGKYDWLSRKYPNLEYLQIVSYICGSVKGIPAFLEQNPNIRKFATNQQFLSENRNEFMNTNVKLDDLAVWMDSFLTKRYCELLKNLYEHGVYKKLQIYVGKISSQKDIDQLASINGLTKLSVLEMFDENYSLLALKNLEELHLLYMVDEVYDEDDYEAMATQLVHLKRIHVKEISMNSITPFICRSVEMQQIVVETLDSYGDYFNRGIINLRALNKEREKLPGAQKITLYVEEKYYLATKWALGETDLALIRLKRLDSFDFNHDFYNAQPKYY